MNNKIIIIFTIALTFYNCKKQSVYQSNVKQEDIKNFKVEETNFTYLSAKAKVNYKDSDNEFHATANLRIKKDSIIWVSLTPALGIEVSRCLITKDSIFILDRLNNQYFQYNFKELSEKVNMNLNYKIFESVFVGNLPFMKKETDSLSKLQKEDYFLLSQKEGELSVENYVKVLTMKLERIKLMEKKAHKELQVVYNDFRPFNNTLFAFNNFVNLTFPKNNGIQTTSIAIEYNKVEIPEKPLNFPFNVPAKFIRKQ